MKMRQQDLFSKHREFKPNRIAHGGEDSKNRRKISRPLTAKKPLHLVLKSSCAKGKLSFLSPANELFIEKTLRTRAQQFGVVVQRYENMGNHIHAVVKFKNRRAFQDFLRTVTALVARFVTGARRGRPFGQRFWDALAFTRVVTGFRDLRQLENYLDKNHCEREYGPEARLCIELDERDIARRRQTVGFNRRSRK